MNEIANKSNRVIARLLPSRPFVFVALLYAIALVFFAILRLAFLLQFHDQVAGETLGEILTAFAIGVRFDQIIILYCLLPILLVTPWVSLSRRWFRRACGAYLYFVFAFAFILLLSDIRFFATFGSHMNFLFYEYIDDGGIFWSMVFSDSGVALSFFIWAILMVLFGYLLATVLRSTARMPKRRSWISQAFWTVAFLALFALGIRGRTGLAPIDWGEAYFSKNAFLNQLALNGLYTLARNYTERDGDLRLSTMTKSERYPFVEMDVAYQTVNDMLRQPNEAWPGLQAGILRSTISPRLLNVPGPNIIVVLLESWAAKNTGVLGSPHNLTPNFDAWSERGILFSNFFANGIHVTSLLYE